MHDVCIATRTSVILFMSHFDDDDDGDGDGDGEEVGWGVGGWRGEDLGCVRWKMKTMMKTMMRDSRTRKDSGEMSPFTAILWNEYGCLSP